MKNMQNIQKLVADIKHYNESYRLGLPIISDSHYDSLVAKLKELDPDNDWFKQTEPAIITSLDRKRKLPVPMKSLNKVKSLGELMQWVKGLGLPNDTKLVIMPKYDGISWLHNEKTGETYSRGGTDNEGMDCTPHYKKGDFNFRFFDEDYAEQTNIAPFNFTYGELVFSRYMWESKYANQISDNGLKYKSPRNTVAGIINRDIPSDVLQDIDFVRYGADEATMQGFSSFSNFLIHLDSLYYQTNGMNPLFARFRVSELTEERLHMCFTEWLKHYYIDGLVVYVDEISRWKTIGRQQTTGNPLYAIAYKHPDFTESFETTVKGITWAVSKAGALKPVVQIDAVDTGDCTMENPTGYNAGWCRDHNIGAGAKILVTRSGGVIPKILETLEPTTPLIPSKCPVCGAPTKFDEKQIELYCNNDECEGRRLSKIAHFFTVVGVENMGDETLLKLFKAGHDTIKKILNIKWGDLMKIEGFGESIANSILDQMKQIKQGVDLATLMHASDCFKGIGKVKAQQFLDKLDDEELCSFCQGWFYSGWQMENYPNHPEFQNLSITQQNLFLGYTSFWKFLEDTKVPFRISKPKAPTGTKYANMSVCFSGIRDKALETEILDQGGKIASGVNKNTTHLVVKDPNGTSTKISKAKQLDIPVITIEEFKAL